MARFDGTTKETCAGCGNIFQQTQLGALSDAILRRKPVCSYECNLKLGQVEPPRTKPVKESHK